MFIKMFRIQTSCEQLTKKNRKKLVVSDIIPTFAL